MLNFLRSKKKLIVVADDFGLCKSVNKGILRSHKEGCVTEISLMVYGPGIDNAIQLVTENDLKQIGIHLTLQGIYPDKHLLGLEDYRVIFQSFTKDEINRATRVELDLFCQKVGHQPTHLAPHQGIHGNLKLLEFLIEYAKIHDIPIRIPRTPLDGGLESENYSAEILLKRNTVRRTNHIFAQISGGDMTKIKKDFLERLASVKTNESAEILFHPGYFDHELMKLSSLTYERARDLSLLMDRKFMKQIEELGFKFINYSDL